MMRPLQGGPKASKPIFLHVTNLFLDFFSPLGEGQHGK